ncbi:hypothetical protein Nepgr_020998 [Nepenthes gracilis]|uniref:phosphoribosylanthranilate isomerase n=1 Tax=Nepenthes gracilis TaxID=150966 RepID=A0AAD3SZ06_NEPGR|nr:hypothetical protein Nepgr_020998 [Nepenthes gracilis]
MGGITSVSDAAMAADAGADFIGMIMWPKSKHSVSVSVAKEISAVTRDFGTVPVAVFVNEDAETILRASYASNIEYEQEKWPIYVLHAGQNGALLNFVSNKECSMADWILEDSAEAGSGNGFNWAQPDGIDVSSSIYASDGIERNNHTCLHECAGADFIGMIMWPKSKRSVSVWVAKEISAVARDSGAIPVAVFVNLRHLHDLNFTNMSLNVTSNVTVAKDSIGRSSSNQPLEVNVVGFWQEESTSKTSVISF